MIYSLLIISLFLKTLSVYAIDQEQLEKRMQQRYGLIGLERLHQWKLFLNTIHNKTEKEKLIQVNDFLNAKIQFQDDRVLWKNIDYWATPLETLGLGVGDCEDYAIVKYFTLLEAGVDVSQLRFIYVKAQIGGVDSRSFQAHMVLGYYESDESIPYILDNLNTNVERADKRTDLKPVFSFNSDGVWVGGQAVKADPTARLSRWRDLIQRTKADGF